MVQEDMGNIALQELGGTSNFNVLDYDYDYLSSTASNKLHQVLERRPTGPYPSETAYFNPFAFYWPNPHGQYIQWFQENVIDYPSSLALQQNESAIEHTSRLMGYRDRFNVYCFNMEPKWRDMISRLKMDRIPVVPYPWLPDYEEYDENFDFSLFESSVVVEESPIKWGLDTRIPGYSLTWKNLSRHLKPELFFTPWIPLACVRFWENCFRMLIVKLFQE
jgi:hypothetical protein